MAWVRRSNDPIGVALASPKPASEVDGVRSCLERLVADSFYPDLTASCVYQIGEAVGRANVKTTQIYTQVLNRGGHGVKSPLDGFGI